MPCAASVYALIAGIHTRVEKSPMFHNRSLREFTKDALDFGVKPFSKKHMNGWL